jgi:hypothetical protein
MPPLNNVLTVFTHVRHVIPLLTVVTHVVMDQKIELLLIIHGHAVIVIIVIKFGIENVSAKMVTMKKDKNACHALLHALDVQHKKHV